MEIKYHLSALACAILASGLALPAAAAEKESGLYFHVGVGPNFAESVDLKISGVSLSGDLDAGVRVSAGVGYNFNKYLGVEFDTGFISNTFEDLHGTLSHIPYMANGVFRYPIGNRLEPYIGGGIGGSSNFLFIHDFGLDDSDVDFNFAWQAMAGLRYKFADNMSIGAGYKYFGTSGGDYHIDGANVHVGNSNNHTLNIAFNMQF